MTMKKFLLAILLFSNATFAVESNIENYVHKLMNESISVLNDSTIDLNAKTAKVRTMLASHMIVVLVAHQRILFSNQHFHPHQILYHIHWPIL